MKLVEIAGKRWKHDGRAYRAKGYLVTPCACGVHAMLYCNNRAVPYNFPSTYDAMQYVSAKKGLTPAKVLKGVSEGLKSIPRKQRLCRLRPYRPRVTKKQNPNEVGKPMTTSAENIPPDLASYGWQATHNYFTSPKVKFWRVANDASEAGGAWAVYYGKVSPPLVRGFKSHVDAMRFLTAERWGGNLVRDHAVARVSAKRMAAFLDECSTRYQDAVQGDYSAPLPTLAQRQEAERQRIAQKVY